jgi:hypothetical protein
MAELIYFLCALTSMTCAWLLIRSYLKTRFRLLFWSGLCFVGLSMNNALLLVDKLIVPTIDLSLWRLLLALLALLLLLFGLIWEEE